MKKISTLFMTLALLTGVANAQNTTAYSSGTTFGIRAGVNFQNINGKDEDGTRMDYDMVTRFNIGVNAEIPVGKDFYFQPGLLFNTKGAKSKEVILGQDFTTRTNLSYLELPLNFVYKPAFGAGHLILGFGPYVGIGLAGEVKYEGGGTDPGRDVKFKNEVRLTDGNDKVYFKPVDAGASLLAGYEFSNRLSFQLNAQLGLTKINPKYEGAVNDKTSLKNTGFGLSLGYRFN